MVIWWKNFYIISSSRNTSWFVLPYIMKIMIMIIMIMIIMIMIIMILILITQMH